MNHISLLLSREKTQNEKLNIRRTIVRLKLDSRASIHFTRGEDQHCLDNIVNKTGHMISIPESFKLQ